MAFEYFQSYYGVLVHRSNYICAVERSDEHWPMVNGWPVLRKLISQRSRSQLTERGDLALYIIEKHVFDA